MSWLHSKPQDSQAEVDAALARMQEIQEKRLSVGELHFELLEERALLFRVMGALQVGMAWEACGEAIHHICQRPLALSSFFLAKVDRPADRIVFPYFYEVGRVRDREDLDLSNSPGLTGLVVHSGKAHYFDSKEACIAHGMRLTEAERLSGLTAQSWFGAPLWNRAGEVAGVMTFQSFQPAAFPSHRLLMMEAVAGVAALNLE